MLNYEELLNPSQYEAVTATEGPLLILAGAGTGKTYAVTHRVAYLVENGVPADRILLLTFTNKAAGEMKDRANKMLDGRCEKITACTFHSFAAKMLRIYGKENGLNTDFTIIDSSDSAELVEMIKSEMNVKWQRYFPKSNAIVGLFSSMINLGLPMEKAADKKKMKIEGYVPELRKIHTKLQEYKQTHNMLDYDDLLVQFRDLLKESESVRNKIAGFFAYVMVDEYQDTNALQDEILQLLRLDNQNLAVVGDDSQSLYGFRGADVKNIIHFPDNHPGCRVVSIMENYRSSQEILDVANYAIDKCATEGYKKKLHGQFHGEKPKKVLVPEATAEADYIFCEIQKLLESGMPPEEICVLSRYANQTYLLETMLTKNKIPYEKYGGIRFLERAHVKDLLSYLRVITNISDEIAWHRVLKQHNGIGNTYARELTKGCRENGFDYLLNAKYKKKKFHEELDNLYDALTKARNMEFHEMLDFLIQFYSKLQERNIQAMNTDLGKKKTMLKDIKDKESDLYVLAEAAKNYRSPVSFLDDLVLDGTGKDPEKEKIVLSTIHSAKGLEYEAVFVMDCIDGFFPRTTLMAQGSPEDNEELRCFYVAVTRAKRKLYLLIPSVYSRFGKQFEGTPSHYIYGADRLLEKVM